MSFTKKVSSSSGSSKNNKYGDCVQFNDPFPKAIESTVYGPILNVPLEYEINLDSSGWHWFLLVKGKMEGANYPLISFEVTTDNNGQQLIPTMRVIWPQSADQPNIHAEILFNIAKGALTGLGFGAAGMALGSIAGAAVALAQGGGIQKAMLKFGGTDMTFIGSKHTTIANLCKTAEKIRLEMGTYNLFSRNCQHFCNNFLSAYGFTTKPTTIGPEISLAPDVIDNIFTLVTEDTPA